MIELYINQKKVMVDEGITVAAALFITEQGQSRTSVSGEIRTPFCGMGVCQECRVYINGIKKLACQSRCEAGMQIGTKL